MRVGDPTAFFLCRWYLALTEAVRRRKDLEA